MNITVEAKLLYGQTYFFPICIQSRMLCDVAKTKTLTREQLHCIQAAGHEVKIRTPEVKL